MGTYFSCFPKLQHTGIVKLSLATPDGEKVLFYRRRDTHAGHRWFREVYCATVAQLPIKDPWRVYNASEGLTIAQLIVKLKSCIETINSHYPGTIPHDVVIEEAMSPRTFQQSLNYAHTYFEILMHSADKPAAFFLTAPKPVQIAIEHYNLFIHALEDAQRQTEKRMLGKQVDVRAVVTLLGRQRVPLCNAELRDFGLARNFGVAYLNYCMVGKHLLEACWDNDQVTGVLRPQTHMSADTLLWFGPSPSTEELAELEAMLDEWWEREGIEARFGRHDPKSALGYLPVADLCRDRGDACGRDEQGIAQLLSNATIASFTAMQ